MSGDEKNLVTFNFNLNIIFAVILLILLGLWWNGTIGFIEQDEVFEDEGLVYTKPENIL